MKDASNVKTIVDKLTYFSEIGEKYTVSLPEMDEIIEKLNKIRTKRRYKVSIAVDGEYAVIWRVK